MEPFATHFKGATAAFLGGHRFSARLARCFGAALLGGLVMIWL